MSKKSSAARKYTTYAIVLTLLLVVAAAIFTVAPRLSSTDNRSQAALQQVVNMIWSFDTTGNAEGWVASNAKTSLRSVNGQLEVTLRSTEPTGSRIEINNLNAQMETGVKRIVFRASASLPSAVAPTPKSRPLPADVAQQQVARDGNPASTYAPAQMTLTVNHKGQRLVLTAQRLPLEAGMSEYTFVIPQTPALVVQSLQLEFANHPEKTVVRLDEIKLVSEVSTITQPPISQTKTVYRLVGQTGGRYFTADQNMRDAMVRNGWTVESTTLKTPTAVVSGAIPVYELYNKNSDDFFYTTNADEARTAKNYGYAPYNTKESADTLPIAWHAFATAASDRVAVYRLVNGTTGKHFYTTNISERDVAVAQFGYSIEGLVFYVLQ